jgi:hypothetical protein
MPANQTSVNPANQTNTTSPKSSLDPSSVSGAVFWGVLAGVITSTVLFVLSQLFFKVLIPWYETIVYKGVDLRGEWIAQNILSNGIQYNYRLVLEQKAHKLTGTMSITKSISPDNYVQGFKVSGSTWEGFVTLAMESDNRKSLSFATSLLQITDRGDSLVGHIIYRSSQNDRVDSENIKWNRS